MSKVKLSRPPATRRWSYVRDHEETIWALESAPFVMSKMRRFGSAYVHRVRYLDVGRGVAYQWCDGLWKNLSRADLLHDVPACGMLCRTCEQVATLAGQPSAFELCGKRHTMSPARGSRPIDVAEALLGVVGEGCSTEVTP